MKPRQATEIVEVERKSPVLKRPSLPCLRRHYTINLSSGCPNECRYCYAQGYESHPGPGRIHFYGNTLKLLERELPRKRKKPRLVFFSTACDPFAPGQRMLEEQYGVMRLLAESNVFILVSTKCGIPEPFLRLFEAHAGRVHVQLGLTTADDSVRALMEPVALSVHERLALLRQLVERGISVEARADPLIPGLTDTDASFVALCRALAGCGVRQMVASCLFLRSSNRERMRVDLGSWRFADIERRLYTHPLRGFCGQGTIWLPPTSYRRERFERLQGIAARHDIAVRFCSCTNPEITKDICHPAPPPSSTTQQIELFRP